MQPHSSTELRSRLYKGKKTTSLRGSCPLESVLHFGRPLDTYTKTLHLLGTPRHASELTRASETEAGGNRSAFNKHGTVPSPCQGHLEPGSQILRKESHALPF